MSERRDPLVPLLASAVVAVVLGTVVFVFYPRVARWTSAGEEAVLGGHASPSTRVPVWVCRGVEGVALLLEPFPADAAEDALQEALRDAPHHFLTLGVYNFAGPEPFTFELPPSGLHSPEGGPPALPAASLARNGLPRSREAVLRGLGAVGAVTVAKGRAGQALLAVAADPARRSSFVAGELR
ncbi:MAG: hypothetical protein ACREID_10075, partial [Planctomycetota bacterium]